MYVMEGKAGGKRGTKGDNVRLYKKNFDGNRLESRLFHEIIWEANLKVMTSYLLYLLL